MTQNVIHPGLGVVAQTHRENGPVTQTTPESTPLSRGGWPREKKNHPAPSYAAKTQSYRAYRATQTSLFSNSLMLPFDTQVCHERQICSRFHQILKVILEITFWGYYT